MPSGRLSKEGIRKIKEFERREAKKLFLKLIAITFISIAVLLLIFAAEFCCWYYLTNDDILEFFVIATIAGIFEVVFIYSLANSVFKKMVKETRRNIKRHINVIKVCNIELDVDQVEDDCNILQQI